jgi:hypothetical protein
MIKSWTMNIDPVPCPYCGGRGNFATKGDEADNIKDWICHECNGTGQISAVEFPLWDECLECEDEGFNVVADHHPMCDGSCDYCPVPVQDPCMNCGGTNEVPRYWTTETFADHYKKETDLDYIFEPDTPIWELYDDYRFLTPYGDINKSENTVMIIAFPGQPAPPRGYRLEKEE